MKLKNVKVDQFVKVKNKASTFERKYIGACGTVEDVEDDTYEGSLTVLIRFLGGGEDWGNHKDIKPVKQ